jgi:hypothetical protein
MTLDLEKLEAVLAAMTPGPWYVSDPEDTDGEVWDGGRDKLVARTSRHPVDANARGIAAIVTHAPALIARVRELEAVAQEARHLLACHVERTSHGRACRDVVESIDAMLPKERP